MSDRAPLRRTDHPVLGPESPPGGPRFRLRWLENGLLVVGILLLALWSRTALESLAFQSAESRKLEAAPREAESGRSETGVLNAAFVGDGIAVPEPATEPGSVLGRIEIPRLRIAAIVAEGSDKHTLSRAVGHIPSTARPGSPGNCALAGHRDSFLRGLGGVRENDVIRIVTLERTYTYQVEWSVVVAPQRVDVLDATADPSLTLVTCYPFEFVGHAPQRFVVRARQVESAAGSTASEYRGEVQPHGLTAEGR